MKLEYFNSIKAINKYEDVFGKFDRYFEMTNAIRIYLLKLGAKEVLCGSKYVAMKYSEGLEGQRK